MYETEYKQKLVTAEQAAGMVKEGDMLVHGFGLAEPPALLMAVTNRLRTGDLKRLKVFAGLPFKHMRDTLLATDLMDCVEVHAQFVGAGSRGLVHTGLAYFVPNHFHQVPRLLREFIGVDVCVTTVSPIDQSGFFSFGTANDYTSTAARAARELIVEVNHHMPRVFGDSSIHISEVDAVVENHRPLVALPNPDSRPEDEIIGKTIAEMIPDGACLQLGFGTLPSVVGGYLEGHKDLGLHTEVFSPVMVNLIKKGVITGAKKTLHPRKHIFTNAIGDEKMLEFMNNNPSIESYPVSYTNHPSVIAQNDRMISVNAVLQVDLTGQCNAEFLYGKQFSGTGGQLDFVRGAFDSKEGKSIIAFYATADKGNISRIVDRLDYGSTVTTPRADTHFLVTEFGIANLKGKSTKERAIAIIGLAHPRFREELFQKAENMYII
jgi:itaconate CoA-transferase